MAFRRTLPVRAERRPSAQIQGHIMSSPQRLIMPLIVLLRNSIASKLGKQRVGVEIHLSHTLVKIQDSTHKGHPEPSAHRSPGCGILRGSNSIQLSRGLPKK